MNNKKIIKYYEKKYDLKIDFELVNDFCLSQYIPNIRNSKQGDIVISKNHIKDLNLKTRFKYTDIKNKLLFTLLHEIKHGIQYRQLGDIFIDTYNIQGNIEHEKRGYEIKADIFARAEFKKWKNRG